jgi:hypothetical protein
LLVQEEPKKRKPAQLVVAMMTSKKTVKVTPKHNETAIPDDPCAGIGLSTVPEPGGFNQYAVFDADEPPETTAKTSTEKGSMLGCKDDDVLVRFNPRYIGTTPGMSSSRHFDEETGLIESKTVKKQLFHDPSMAESEVGGITGGCSAHFRSSLATPKVSNKSIVHGYHVSLVIRTVSVLVLGIRKQEVHQQDVILSV